MKTNNRGKNKAKQVLDDIGFDEITDLSNEELVSGLGAILILEPLENSDGKIIRGKRRTIIKVNSRIEYPEKIRYTIAHELGHYFLHEKLELHNDNSNTLNWFNAEHKAKKGIQEYEANDFAAELLMPENKIKEFVHQKPFSPQLIKDISERFNTSLTSVVNRLTNLDIFPFVAFYIYDGIVKYWRRTNDVRGYIKEITQLSPPEDSVAMEYIEANYDFIYQGKEKTQEIYKSTWFNLHKFDEDSEYFEYCIPTKKYKSIISVVWEE